MESTVNEVLKLLLDSTHAYYPYIGGIGLIGRGLWDVSQGDASGAIACISAGLSALGIGHGLFRGAAGGGPPAATAPPEPASGPVILPVTPPPTPAPATAPRTCRRTTYARLYQPSAN